MIRATICFALFLTLWLSVAVAMSGGNPWPMMAAAALAIVAPSALRR